MKNFKLELNENEVNLILGSLGKLSYETSYLIISLIQNQCKKQLAEKPKKEATEKLKKE